MSSPFVARRLDPDARYGLRVTLFAVAFLLVAIPFGWLLNQVESDGSLVDLDTSGAASLHDWVHRTTFAVGTLKAVTFLGAPPWLWFLVIVGTLVLRPRPTVAPGDLPCRHHRPGRHPRHDREDHGEPSPAVGARPDHHRPREELPVGPRHVVDHRVRRAPPGVPADGAPSLAAGRPSWRTVLLVALIGFSRLGLGVHYLSDVVGGYVLGTGVAGGVHRRVQHLAGAAGEAAGGGHRGPRARGRRRPALSPDPPAAAVSGKYPT